MKATTVSIIKATAPLVSQHARKITGLFYKNMFANNPETLQFFNQANQVYSAASQNIDPQFYSLSLCLPYPYLLFLIHIFFCREMAVNLKRWQMQSSPSVPILKISAHSHQQFGSWP
jgi:hypothetical protein